MLNDTQAAAVLQDVFFQRDKPRVEEVTEHTKFAHYTSAETAMRIIRGEGADRALWLRNATEMNDFLEVNYGQSLLRDAFSNQEFAKRLVEACDAINPIVKTAFERLDLEFQRIKHETYLLSLVLHNDLELAQGKLSMWRAYGGDANVCLLLNNGPFLGNQTAYDAYIAPVDYSGPMGFAAELNRMVTAMIEERGLLQQINPHTVAFNLKYALDTIVLSTKHPGFEEENEWRVIHRNPEPPAKSNVPSKIVAINGIVQKVHYLPMRNIPEEGLTGAELPELLDALIVGPTMNPPLVVAAFVELLEAAGVPDASAKVRYCGVPLRR